MYGVIKANTNLSIVIVTINISVWFFVKSFIFFQDSTVTLVLVTYQCIFLFFITHTAAMYLLMSDEILLLNRRRIRNTALIRRKLSDIIRRHGLILNLMDCLRMLYSTPMGIDFVTNVYFMCLFLSLTLQDWISLASPFIYCVIVFFLYCFLCQKLIDASVIFESSVYGCGWEQFDMSEKKTVYIMLKVARRPIKLFAANIVPIDLNTFAVTVQNMYKFVTALKV
ncbi:putative odorant receptor 19b [Aricia agestis]|uniref:putative odorant receptor 19b n=1 Tax=Aricia agestis TaxID=91739 RepID=UPI001C208001|nr:putative odorant receptor 19b [Aricia agestis]